MAQKGYKDVVWFRDGIPSWIQAGYPLDTSKALPKTDVPSINAEQLKSMLSGVYLLDIREISDIGRIEASHDINIDDMSSRYTELPKTQKIVIVDHIGKQSVTAARFLKNEGYDDVVILQGGIMSWINQGYPVTK